MSSVVIKDKTSGTALVIAKLEVNVSIVSFLASKTLDDLSHLA